MPPSGGIEPPSGPVRAPRRRKPVRGAPAVGRTLPGRSVSGAPKCRVSGRSAATRTPANAHPPRGWGSAAEPPARAGLGGHFGGLAGAFSGARAGAREGRRPPTLTTPTSHAAKVGQRSLLGSLQPASPVGLFSLQRAQQPPAKVGQRSAAGREKIAIRPRGRAWLLVGLCPPLSPRGAIFRAP